MKQTWAFFLWIWTFLCLPKLPLFSLMPFFSPVPHFLCFLVFPTEPVRPHSLSLSPQLFSVCILCHVPGSPNSHYVPPFLQSFPFFSYIFFRGARFYLAENPRLHFISVGKPRQELKAAAHITSSQEQRNECTCASAQLHSFSSYLLWLHIEGGSFLFYSMTFISSPEL